MENQLFDILKLTGPFGAVTIIVWILYKAGLLQRWGGGGGNTDTEKRFSELEEFRALTEKNHFHDLDELKNDVRKLMDKVNEIDKRVVRVETKIFNGE